ncbi:MAG: hypothetical protein IT495_16065 [Gammaproteobacteria bacterium]|nr:hypothetical protein [Gammaproteobacteria bacterium]
MDAMDAAQGGGEIGIVGIIIILGIYLFYCYCLKLICEKGGVEPGVLVWIPLIQILPTLKVASLHPALILLYLVPVVNLVFFFVHWWKVCEALQRSPWLVLMNLVPVVNLAFIPLLAFTGPPAAGVRV